MTAAAFKLRHHVILRLAGSATAIVASRTRCRYSGVIESGRRPGMRVVAGIAFSLRQNVSRGFTRRVDTVMT